MIRHIVSWKLTAEDEPAKAQAAGEIAAALEGLVGTIPEIVTLKVSRNVAYADKNHDVVLVADFETLDGLDEIDKRRGGLVTTIFFGSGAATICHWWPSPKQGLVHLLEPEDEHVEGSEFACVPLQETS